MTTSFYLNLHKEDIIKSYQEGSSSLVLGEKYGVGWNIIIKYLKQWGIKIKIPGKYMECEVNHFYFSNIETERQAYWLGFLAADGSVDVKRSRISLGLAANNTNYNNNDYWHIKKFQTDLQSTHNVGVNKGVSRITITSKQIVSDLLTHGIHPNKCRTVRPAILEPGLMRHYWRGVIDGDGCLYVRKGAVTLSCNSFEIVNGFKNYCIGVNREIRAKVRLTNKINNFVFYTVGTSAIPILKDLYGECELKLERKYQQYLEIKESWI